MLTVIVEALLFQVGGQLVSNNRFQNLTWNWCKWNWSIVVWVTSVSPFEDWTHTLSQASNPVVCAFLQRFVENYCQRQNCSPLVYFSAMYRLRWYRRAFLR